MLQYLPLQARSQGDVTGVVTPPLLSRGILNIFYQDKDAS